MKDTITALILLLSITLMLIGATIRVHEAANRIDAVVQQLNECK